MGLIIGLITIVLVGFLIIRGYNAKGVLFVGGVALLILAAIGNSIGSETFLANSKAIGGDKSSGLFFVDISKLIFNLMEKRSGGLGLLIMTLVGFSAYMSHIGANDSVIRILSRPLAHIRSRYFLLIGGFFIGSLLSFAISSATALGAFLMATLFPILTNLGISRPSAAAVCATTAMLTLSPLAGDVALASAQTGLTVKEYAFSYMIPMSIFSILAVAVAHFFWQPYCDRREGLVAEAGGQKIEMDLSALKEAPAFYMVLPFLPILGMLIFDGKIEIGGRVMPEMSLGAVVILTMMIALVIEYIRKRNAKELYEGLEVAYRQMGAAFAGVVILLIAAGVFAEGLSNIGFVDEMIALVERSGAAGITMMFALVGVTLMVVVASGSGNAAFYAFVELAPKLAGKLGLNPTFLILPMQQISNVGRTLSPVSGVMVAVSGAGNISPMLLIKRTCVPTIAAIVVVLAYTLLFIPMHTA